MAKSVRVQWPTNFTYILAAIGCAAGLGNLWRFPYLAYEHGGAAFILALLIANILVAFPLLMMESVIGQKFQKASPQSFEEMKKGTSWIQWIAVFSIAIVLTYYAPVMAWAIKYFFQSFSGEFLAAPAGYFTENILQLSSGIADLGIFNWGLFASLLLGYLIVFLSMRKEIITVSSVLKFTVILPFFVLFILIIRGITLPGAAEGLAAFFIPNWSSLLDVALWKAAIAQSFFSASVAIGYFIMAASHRDEKAEIPKASILILVGNFAVSLLAGLAVFSTLGFMATQQGVPVAEVVKGGPMLVFSVLPTAVSMLPAFQVLFAVLLFLVVITLAIDSIFGIVELVSNAFTDMKEKTRHYTKVMLSVLLFGIIAGLPYMFGAGLYFLDIIDHFVTEYIFLIVGLLEAGVVAYFIGASKVRSWINATAENIKIGKWFDIVVHIIPLALAYLLAVNIHKEFQEAYGGYPIEYLILFGALPLILIFVLSFIFSSFTKNK